MTNENQIPYVTREAAIFLILKIMFISISSHFIILIINILGDFYRQSGNVSPLRIDELDTAYGAIVIALELIIIMHSFIKWTRTTYTVNKEAIIKESGIFLRRGHTYQLHDVESVSYKETFFGKIFQYSNIWLHYANRNELLYAIPQPKMFRNLIQNKIDTIKKTVSPET
jgi:uncharacterized membrane protein YdbT with pleckstrin-like domain